MAIKHHAIVESASVVPVSASSPTSAPFTTGTPIPLERLRPKWPRFVAQSRSSCTRIGLSRLMCQHFSLGGWLGGDMRWTKKRRLLKENYLKDSTLMQRPLSRVGMSAPVAALISVIDVTRVCDPSI